MSKRRLENEIGKLSDEILGGLSPDKRLQLVLRSRAEDNEQEVDQLMESCPRYGVLVKDREFTNRLQLSQQYAKNAIYGLHTAYLQYEFVVQKQRNQELLDEERETTSSDTERDRAAEWTKRICALLINLYTSYHAHRRFATEVLDVDLKTWVVVHPQGATVIDAVVDVIDDQERIELAKRRLTGLLEEEEESEADDTDQTAPDSEPMTLDDMVEIRYEMLHSDWANKIGESSE